MLDFKDPGGLIYAGHPLHKVRLYQLAMHLWKLPDDYENFTMTTYNSLRVEKYSPDWDEYYTIPENVNGIASADIKCNTSACAVGHAPSVFPELTKELNSIVEFDDEGEGFWWPSVCSDILGVRESSDLYYFLFGEDWSENDNTPKGAAKRIFFYLMHGECVVEKIAGECGDYSEELMEHYQGLSPEDITLEMLEV